MDSGGQDDVLYNAFLIQVVVDLILSLKVVKEIQPALPQLALSCHLLGDRHHLVADEVLIVGLLEHLKLRWYQRDVVAITLDSLFKGFLCIGCPAVFVVTKRVGGLKLGQTLFFCCRTLVTDVFDDRISDADFKDASRLFLASPVFSHRTAHAVDFSSYLFGENA